MKREHSHGNKKITRVTAGIVASIVIVLLLALTNPSRADFVAWLASEHHIHASYDVNGGTTYIQTVDGQEKSLILKNGHLQHWGIYTTYDQLFTDADGKEIRIKAVGILNMFMNR